MPLILFAQTMFGNLIAIRILREFSDRSLISTHFLCGVGIVFAVSTSLLAIFPGTTSSSSLAIQIPLICGLRFLLTARESSIRRSLHQQLPLFLDGYLLNLRTGAGLSAARETALMACDKDFAKLMRPLFCGTEGSRHLFLDENWISELRAVAEEPHSAVPRLQNLRETLRRSDRFRRRSGQALRQANVQAAVLLILQIFLSAFTAVRSGWRANADYLFIGAALAVIGAYLLNLLARRIKWTL